MDKITVENMNLYYGNFHALKDVNLRMEKNKINGLYRSVGLR